MKKKEMKYLLTLKGLLMLELGSEQAATKLLDSLELFGRRNDFNAVHLFTHDFINVSEKK